MSEGRPPSEQQGDPGRPEYGPAGYLPPRAAHRARKIVLRGPMGVGWSLAAIVAAVAVLSTGGFFVWSRAQPPGPPLVLAAPLRHIDARGAAVVDVGALPVLIVRAGGSLRAFAAPAVDVGWCEDSQRLERPTTASVWALDGALLGGRGRSLPPLRAVVHDGDVYVDPTPGDPAVPRPAVARPACGL